MQNKIRSFFGNLFEKKSDAQKIFLRRNSLTKQKYFSYILNVN